MDYSKQYIFPTHGNCANFRNGFCTLAGVAVSPNEPACPNFKPKSTMRIPEAEAYPAQPFQYPHACMRASGEMHGFPVYHARSYYRSQRRSFFPPRRYGSLPQYSPTQPKPQVKQFPTAEVFKVAVASQGQDGLDDLVSPMFGRCPAFTIVEVEKGRIKGVNVVPNQAANVMQGAGIAAVQALVNMGAKAILAGRFGPNAFAVCSQAGIQMIPVQPGTKIVDAVQSFISGKLRPISVPTAPMHSGTSFASGTPGIGTSMGMGMRRGGGEGRGRMGGFGAGPGGSCLCPRCGYRTPHVMGTPCFQQICPQCGSKMIRER